MDEVDDGFGEKLESLSRPFAGMNLSDKDFQRIGEMVVARIAALRGPKS
jgi:hypothetical protein